MPVVVTGADEPRGRAVVDALLAAGAPEVRATVRARSAVAELVALGVRTAVSDLLDPEQLAGVLTGAFTVVHLAGPDPAVTLPPVLAAAEDTGVRRVVTVAAEPAAEAPLVTTPVGGPEVVLLVGGPTEELVAAVVAADRVR